MMPKSKDMKSKIKNKNSDEELAQEIDNQLQEDVEESTFEEVLSSDERRKEKKKKKKRNEDSLDQELNIGDPICEEVENPDEVLDEKRKKKKKKKRDKNFEENELTQEQVSEDIPVSDVEKKKKKKKSSVEAQDSSSNQVLIETTKKIKESESLADDSLMDNKSGDYELASRSAKKKRVSFDTSWEECSAAHLQHLEELKIEKAKLKKEKEIEKAKKNELKEKKKKDLMEKLNTRREKVSTRSSKRTLEVVIEDENEDLQEEEQFTSKRSKKNKKKKLDKDSLENPEEASTSTEISLDGDMEDEEEHESFEFDDDLDDDDADLDLEQLRAEYELPSAKTDRVIDESLVSNAPLHLLLKKLTVPSPGDHLTMKKHGLQMSTGRFSKIENAILERNWKRYLDDYNIPNRMILFGFFGYQTKHRDVKRFYHRFSNDTRLLLRLAKDLPGRTLYQVYCRSRDLLSGLKTSFTAEDREVILQLYKAHGDKYSQFCEERGYHPKWACYVVRTNLKQNGVTLKRGSWSSEEMQKLKEVVESVMKHHGLTTYDGIPWSLVARSMQRSDMQCRQRFFTKVMYMMMRKEGSADAWDDRLDMAKLVALLRMCPFEDESMIDWDFVKEQFSSKSFNHLLVSWRKVRLRVPDGSSLPAILDHLYETRVEQVYRQDADKMREINEFVEAALVNLNN